MEIEEPGEDFAALEEMVSEQEDEATPPAAFVAGVIPANLRRDPSAPPYPRGLVLDLVLRTAPVVNLLAAYKLTTEEFKTLVKHPVFLQDLRDVREKVREEGFSFKVKAQAQAEAYLKSAWEMVHNPETPANVRADIIKWTTKIGGLEPKPSAPGYSDASQALPMLAEQLKNMSSHDLELRVLQVIMKRSAPTTEPLPSVYAHES